MNIMVKLFIVNYYNEFQILELLKVDSAINYKVQVYLEFGWYRGKVYNFVPYFL